MNNLHSHQLQFIRRILVVCFGIILSLPAMCQHIKFSPQKCTNGKWGYLRSSYASEYYERDYERYKKDWLFKPIFEEASEFNADSVAVVKKDGKYRFMNMAGDFILPTQYNYAENFYQGIGIITDETGSTYAINYQGERISPNFEELHRYERVIYGKKKDSKGFSLLDAKFNEINSRIFHKIEVRTLPYKFDGNECYYLICHNADGRVSYCDALGNEIVKPKYTDIEPPYQLKPKEDSYIGLYVKWKKTYNDGIHDSDWEWFKILRDPETKMWGVVELKDGNAIVPFKHEDVRKMYKKTAKMYKFFKSKIKSKAYRDSVLAVYGPASQKIHSTYIDIATAEYPQKPNVIKPVMLNFASLTPDSVTGKDKRMILLRDSVQFGKPYRDIVRIKNLIIVTDTMGKKGFMDYYATILPQCPYDEILLWDDSTSLTNKYKLIDYIIVKKNEKYGLINTKGDIVIPIEYDMISQSDSYSSSSSIAIKNGLYYIINQKGEVSARGYDDVQERKGNSCKVTKYGVTTTYRYEDIKYSWGEVRKGEDPTLYERATEEVNRYSDYKKKVEAWELAAVLGNNNEEIGNAYNNAGVLCIQNGKREDAYYYYEKGAALGNKYSISNLKALRNQDAGGQNSNGWLQLADALGNLANTLNTALQQSKGGKHVNKPRTVQYTRNTSSNTNRSTSRTTSSGGNSKAFYQSQYNRWENVARSVYQSATNLGITVKDKNNKDMGGTYGGKTMYWNTYKNNLTKAQREMRNIRMEAQRNGHVIPQSNYETVTLILR